MPRKHEPPRRKCEEMSERSGQPCKNWAEIGSDPPQCNVHAGNNKNADDAANREAAKDEFLAVYERTGDKTMAAASTLFSLRTIRRWRRLDSAFAEEWDAIKWECTDRLETSLLQRGQGVEVTETTEAYDPDLLEMKVIKVVTKTVFDTAAAALWLRGNEPDRYRDSKWTQPPPPRRAEDEDVIKGIMADDALRGMMNQLLDADLSIGREDMMPDEVPASE